MENDYSVFYLKFSSKEEADLFLGEVNYYKTIETQLPDSDDVEIKSYYSVDNVPGDIDIVGEIWNDDGVYDFDQETGQHVVVSEPTKKDGWHVNIILSGDLPEDLQEFVVEPETPSRKFAGF